MRAVDNDKEKSRESVRNVTLCQLPARPRDYGFSTPEEDDLSLCSAVASGLGGQDLICDFIACALKCSPHVPTRNGAVGSPALPECQQFLWGGHMFFAVGDGPSLLDTKVVYWQHVWAAEVEDQKHLDCPRSDSPY